MTEAEFFVSVVGRLPLAVAAAQRRWEAASPAQRRDWAREDPAYAFVSRRRE